MSAPVIVGFSGSFSTPSNTRVLVEEAVKRTVARFKRSSETYDLSQFGSDLGSARNLLGISAPGRHIVERITHAKALVIACPVYKGSYPGLFKHLFDLLDPNCLVGKPILLAAVGSGEKHALVVEHHLRPLFGFFEAQTLATGVYACTTDFAEGKLVSSAVNERLDRAVGQLAPYLERSLQHEFTFDNVTPLRPYQENLSAVF
ncbi:NAD(P)H-dependent oxidoreductase [Rhizobium sp.]|jgi:FMN reductase|uniref:NAD(P)H-dependent oxidoreductase n=1 Tax=Rhizobium sp. TaxID=391 RepID=UPI000E8C276A|nr:FMN reductase [Rhizobium sp.]